MNLSERICVKSTKRKMNKNKTTSEKTTRNGLRYFNSILGSGFSLVSVTMEEFPFENLS